MSVIDDIKQRTDIVEVISQYAKVTKAGKNLRALCPFHSEKQPSFFIYPDQQSWHCFGACNTGGDVFSFIMKKEGISFGDALRLLAERAGVRLPSRFEQDEGKTEKDRIYQTNLAAAQYFNNLLVNSPAAQKVRDYVLQRGLTAKTVADFQIGYSLDSWDAIQKYLGERGYTEDDLLTAGLIVKAETGKLHDRFRNRLMFPITDVKGMVIGFGARALDDSMPKYLNSPQTAVFDKSGTLYGLGQARTAIRQHDVVIIVEGYVDVITAHQYGFTNVVASMGTAITDRHLNDLKKLTKNVILALDSDSAGEEAMLRCVGYENLLGAEMRVVILPEGKDPDEVIKESTDQWQKLLEKAMPVIDFTFDSVSVSLDLSTARDKSLAVDRLLPVISGIENAVRRDHYLNKLARLTQTSYRSIEYALAKLKTGRITGISKSEERVSGVKTALASPIEEYLLCLLLKHPELKAQAGVISPEYFQNSENREIFLAWQRAAEVATLKEELDPLVQEHLEYLINRELPAIGVEQRLEDCILRLREGYLRSLEAKKMEVLTAEAEVGGTAAELAKLQEQGIDVSLQLGEVFKQRVKGAISKEVRNGK